METIWIIGTGRFGRLAVERLSQSGKQYRFVLVDADGKGFELIAGPDRTLERADGVEYLHRHLRADNAPDWIIPSLPAHLAVEWCMLRLADEGRCRIPLPDALREMVPNPMRGLNGDLFVTHATFLCPDNCPEPARVCSVTGEERPPNMFDLLGELDIPGFSPLVIRSYQLSPGVGGYRPSQLFNLLETMRANPSKLLVSTACRCHGVITGVSGKE